MDKVDLPTMLIGAMLAIMLICAVSVIGLIGGAFARQSIFDQCTGKYHEFDVFGHTFTCTEQK